MCDFWRLCILYKYGGIYVDADIYFQGSPRQIMNTNDAVVGIYGHSFGKMAKHL
ncbi:MAG: hypothetical protein EBS86_16715, partial [Crocinitomicaceae bacterium]|nr:hypothetical protein [Crocinitomicaceae bacterium]